MNTLSSHTFIARSVYMFPSLLCVRAFGRVCQDKSASWANERVAFHISLHAAGS